MKLIKLATIFCAVALCLSLGACNFGGGDESSQSSRSSVSESSRFESSRSDPDFSIPDISIPDISLPDISLPDMSYPEASNSLIDPGSSDPALDINVNAMSVDFSQIGALDKSAVNYGSGNRKTPDGKSESALIFKNKYSAYAADFMRDEEGKIYLTFDEGYENGYTAPILDVLKEKNVSAVFFVTMHYAKSNPELIRRMIDEGHIVANHTANHPEMPNISLEKAAAEITELHQYIKENFDYEMSLFRFPQGMFSESTLKLVEELGYRSVFWSFAYKDWDVNSQPDNAAALKKITDFAHDGAIYLLHAVSKTNAEVLGDAIDGLRTLGYELEKYPA